MELTNNLDVVLCDLKTCHTVHKLNSHHGQLQENNQSSDIMELPECSSPTNNSRSVNGDTNRDSVDKKLVVKMCDFMVCSRRSCDVPDCQKDEIRKEILELKKRRSDQQYFRSRKKQRYKKESENDASDFEEITNGKKVFNVDESSDDDDSDGVELLSDKSDSDSKEEASDEEISYEESDGSDWEEKYIPGKRTARIKKEKLEEKEKQKKIKEEEKQRKKEEQEKKKKSKEIKMQTENLSSYELERQKHLDDKMAFLKSLMINEIVDDLEETAQKLRKPIVRKPKEILEVSRKSKRMENVKLNLSEQALQAKVYNNPTNFSDEPQPEIPSICSFEDAIYTKGSVYDHDNYFTDMEIKEETSYTNSPYDLDRLDPDKFTSYSYPLTLTSFAFHPAVDRTIILAGFISGQISLWNTNTEPYIYTPHSQRVTLIKVNPESPSQIFSSSYDGTVRQTDIENKSFIKVFQEEDALFKYFDFISPTEFLIAQSNGCVSLADNRETRFRSGFKREFHCAEQWKCSSSAIRTISAHPTKKDLCLTLDSDGLMKVWDRRFRKASVSQATTRGCVLSAFFSPVTGNSILCSSKVLISIYDSSCVEKRLRFKQKFETIPVNPILERSRSRRSKKGGITTPHCSQSTFFTMADWLPRSDSAFIVSNNVQKKNIIMESDDGRKISSLNNTGGIMVFQKVHPVHNMLAVSYNPTSSPTKSKIHVYMKEICT